MGRQLQRSRAPYSGPPAGKQYSQASKSVVGPRIRAPVPYTRLPLDQAHLGDLSPLTLEIQDQTPQFSLGAVAPQGMPQQAGQGVQDRSQQRALAYLVWLSTLSVPHFTVALEA